MDSRFKGLRTMNIVAALLHLGQAIAVLVLATDMKVPVMTSFLKFDNATQSLLPNQEVWFSLPLGLLVSVFFFMSAAAHLAVSLPVLNDWYNKNLAKGINPARWIEYSFSASTMILIISMLVGISDAAALIPILFVNAAMILFGWMMELHNGSTSLTTGQSLRDLGKTNWTSFIFGCIAGLAPWLAIGLYLWSPGSESNPPSFVYWIFFSIFIFFNTFAINQYLQYKKVGKWADYLYGERAYIILSLVAKSLLAWQVFAGTLRP